MDILTIEPTYNGQTLAEALASHKETAAYNKMQNCINSLGYNAAKNWLDGAPVAGKEREAMEKALKDNKQ